MTTTSAYIHIPFCRSKCRYCDFASFADIDHLMVPYVESLITEIRHAHPMEADTLFIGGGTPSHLPLAMMENIVVEFGRKFRLAEGAETTIEVNPHSASFETLKGYRQLGLNRLSIGIQSFNEKMLKQLGRIHSARDAVETVEEARRAGFANISLDIMFGLPGQSMDDFRADLKAALALSPEHLSVYQLTLEDDTPFADMVEQGVLTLPEDTLQLAMYEEAIRLLAEAGFEHYEVANFAKPGKQCRHNLAYWLGKEFVGFGSGAHSFIDGIRYANPDDVEDYLRDIAVGGESGVEILTDEKDKIIDYLLMRLRLVNKEVSFNELSEKFKTDFKVEYDNALKNISFSKMANVSPTGFSLTHNGLIFLDTVLLEFEKV